MDGDSNSNFDWDSEDDREIDNSILVKSSGLATASSNEFVDHVKSSSSAGSSGSKLIDHFIGMGFPEKVVADVIRENGDENTDHILGLLLKYSERSSASSSGSKVIDHFVGMGFTEDMVVKAIQENGEENTDSILETLLTYSVIGQSPQKQPQNSPDQSSEYEGSFLDDFSDVDSSDDEIKFKLEDEEDSTLVFLREMGYDVEEAAIAIERCGSSATVEELSDFICAAHLARAADALLPEEAPKRRKLLEDLKQKKKKREERNIISADEDCLHLPNPMIGYGIPESDCIAHRVLPPGARGPPYFYYENVALAPKGVWQTISRHLYDVEPEFVDSKYFCAAARKRGYVHNLPIHNRFPLLPLPPRTIHDALPMTRRWWPEWDHRTQLNCLQTCVGSAQLTSRIRRKLEDCEGVPPEAVQKYILYECRKWNLVWVGRNKVAPLEPDEVEMLLGFPRNHTRGGGVSRTDRYKSLGNSFQVDTVAYHFSVMKDLFPNGLNVLSLFSGIGGGEVALHRLGIRMKNVVSIEISEANRDIMRSWWEQTNQTGTLYHIADVQQVNASRLKELMETFGAFDLVVGGSPCNNLAGSNRHHRDGLEGKESSLFYEYTRILDLVRNLSRDYR